MNLTCPQPPRHPHWGRKQSQLPLKCSEREIAPFLLHFYNSRLKGCHFPLCEWVAVGCGLSQSGPGGDVQGCDGPCLRTQTREEDVQLWGQRALWSHIPKLLQRCLQPWPKYQIQSCKHCGHNITLSFTHIDVYVVLQSCGNNRWLFNHLTNPKPTVTRWQSHLSCSFPYIHLASSELYDFLICGALCHFFLIFSF